MSNDIIPAGGGALAPTSPSPTGTPVPAGAPGIGEVMTADPVGRAALAVLGEMSGGDQQIISVGVETLPPGAKAAIIAELTTPATTIIASDSDLADFAETPHGRDLAALWGPDFRYNYSRLVSRAAAIFDRLGDADAYILWQWIETLPPSAFIGLCRGLAR